MISRCRKSEVEEILIKKLIGIINLLVLQAEIIDHSARSVKVHVSDWKGPTAIRVPPVLLPATDGTVQENPFP